MIPFESIPPDAPALEIIRDKEKCFRRSPRAINFTNSRGRFSSPSKYKEDLWGRPGSYLYLADYFSDINFFQKGI